MIVAQRVSDAARKIWIGAPGRRAAWIWVISASAVLVLIPFFFKLDGRAHADWMQFLGRFHPVLLHLPIGLIVLVPVFEAMGRRRPALQEAAGVTLQFAVAMGLLTLVLGYLLAYGSGDTGSTVTRHMWGAIALCVELMLCVMLRAEFVMRGVRLYPGMLCIALLTLLWTAHQGGSLTHGGDYLTRYMPAGLKRLTESGNTSVSANSFYALHIHPVLDAKCVVCHGRSKEQGGLRVDSYSSLMKGGKDGAVIAAGHPENSLLLGRVTLPPNDKHFMPAEGRTPLTPEEVSMMRAWILAGASADVTSVAGYAAAERPKDPPLKPVGDYGALMGEIRAMQQSQGAKLVPVSSNPADGLVLQTADVSSRFDDGMLAGFEKFTPYVVEAELARTAITDAGCDVLTKFSHLRALHLEGTGITGNCVSKLSSLSDLTYLNLSQTRVTAEAIKPLAKLSNLRHIYLFDTPAQPATPTDDEASDRSKPE